MAARAKKPADIENPFFTALVRGIEDVARDEGFRLMLCNSDEDLGTEAMYIDVAIAERMAGVVIAVASTSDSSLDRLIDRQIPVVAVDRRPARHDVDSVVIDNRLGGEHATDHPLTAAPSAWGASPAGPAQHRRRAPRWLPRRVEASRPAGRPRDRPSRRLQATRRHDATLSLLGLRHAPDALFVANNLMTLGALRALQDAGMWVPEDVLLVGFDDAPWTTMTHPQLTVVSRPTYQIGRVAARLLTTSGEHDAPQHVVLSPTLVVRESSVKP